MLFRSEVGQYAAFERRRLSMRPGITCLWQVGGRNELGFADWVKLDLEYIEDSACDTDMNVVMTGAGHYVEVQGTAEGVAFTRAEMDQLLALGGSDALRDGNEQQRGLRTVIAVGTPPGIQSGDEDTQCQQQATAGPAIQSHGSDSNIDTERRHQQCDGDQHGRDCECLVKCVHSGTPDLCLQPQFEPGEVDAYLAQ